MKKTPNENQKLNKSRTTGSKEIKYVNQMLSNVSVSLRISQIT